MEKGKIIVVDFEKRRVSLTLEYERSMEEVKHLENTFKTALSKINDLTKDKSFTRAKWFEFQRILRQIEIRLEEKMRL